MSLQNYYFFFIYQKKSVPLCPIMNRFYFTILLLLCYTCVFSQTHASADALFQAGDYTAAQEQYAQLIKRYPNHALYTYRYARCAQELGDLNTALKYFELSGDRYDLKFFNVAEIHLQLWHPDQAIEAYEAYLARPNVTDERKEYVHTQLQYAQKLQRYMRRVERLQVIDTILVPIDSLLYALPLSSQAGHLTYDSLGHSTYTNQRGDYQLSIDSSYHIVASHRLLDQWAPSMPLPEDINFTHKQSNPYMLSDGVTLYFAACDSNGLGQYDLYISRYNTANDTYTTPENLGLPYNSPANEYFLVIDEEHNVGYLATDRHAQPGYAHIYSFIPNQQKQYWRNISPDSLAQYAQLKRFAQPTAVQQDTINQELTISMPDSTPVLDIAPQSQIFFVVNDSVVYTHLDHFQHPDARSKYHEWQERQASLLSDQHHLEQLRQQYALADEATKKELTPAILQLENNQSQSIEYCQHLLQEIRAIESLKVR